MRDVFLSAIVFVRKMKCFEEGRLEVYSKDFGKSEFKWVFARR